MNQDVYIPDYMKTSHDQRFFQALANHITRTSGEIEWTTSGPVVDGVNISYQFMYPPIYGVDEEIEKLNNPKKDRKFITLTVEEIEFITGRKYTTIHIVGGGSNAEYLNQLTAEKTGKKVLAGPSEATAIGNLVAQMIAAGVYQDAKEARKSIFESFEIKKIQSR